MISLAPYRGILAVADFRRSALASVLARLPLGLASLSLLLAVQESTGDSALAGLISGLYVLGLGLVAPVVGRIIDRFGPRALLLFSGFAYPLLMALLIAAIGLQMTALWWAPLAVLCGATLPQVTVQMRSAIPRLLPEPGMRQAAFTIDTLIIEAVFIVGPPLCGLFLLAGGPLWATATAAACGGIGALWFLRTPAVRGWVRHPGRELDRSLVGALREPGLRAVLWSCLFYSLCFGLFEIGVAAFCQSFGAPEHTGWVLGLASIGSATGVLIYGSRNWPGGLTGQYRVGLLCTGLLLAMAALTPSLTWLYPLTLLASVPMASVLVMQSLLVARIAPAGRIAESYTWVGTALLFGISAGLIGGGMLVAISSAADAVWAACGCALLATWLGRRVHRHQPITSV